MKLYVMRHCERNMNDVSFESPLIYEGQMNAKKKYDEMNKKKIDTIYSSPFLRTIQTADFYSKIKEIPINIDYSIAEYVASNDKINMYSINNFEIPDTWKNNFHIYLNKMIHNKYNKDETVKDAIYRVFKFLLHLKKTYKGTNKNILIVTHMSIVNIILGLKNHFTNIDDIDKYIENFYPMGNITEFEVDF